MLIGQEPSGPGGIPPTVAGWTRDDGGVSEDVTYRRLDAAAPLLVEHAWSVRSAGPLREVLLPDGRGLLQLEAATPATLVDPWHGARRPDGDGLRGVTTRAAVREQAGPSARVGLQLHPLALARLLPDEHAVAAAVGTVLDPTTVLPGPDLERARAALVAGDDEGAVATLLAALVARATDPDELVAFGEVLAFVDAERGLVTPAQLAREAEVTVSTLHRWSVRHLGVEPARYLAAVRFAAFVREAVGTGPVRPGDVVATVRWYAQAGYPPREVERFTGLTPVELRRLEERVAGLAQAPA